MLNDAKGFSRIIIACGRTDLRRGIDGLAAIVQEQFQMDPGEKNVLFLFCGTKPDRIKGLVYPYVYVDGIYLRRNWGGEYENVSVLVAIAVNEDGYREVLGAAEGMKEDKASWVNFFQWLKGRGLDGVKLIVGDKCLGMLEAVGEVFPDANTSAVSSTFTGMCSASFQSPK